jgi:ABC-type multidrug transport system fused ATPase/permease subunit
VGRSLGVLVRTGRPYNGSRLYLLEAKKKETDANNKKTASALAITLLQFAVLIVGSLCFGYLLYLFAIAALWFICGFMISASLLIVALAYAFRTLDDMARRGREEARDEAERKTAKEEAERLRREQAEGQPKGKLNP